jgi:hypothetical protein
VAQQVGDPLGVADVGLATGTALMWAALTTSSSKRASSRLWTGFQNEPVLSVATW